MTAFNYAKLKFGVTANVLNQEISANNYKESGEAYGITTDSKNMGYAVTILGGFGDFGDLAKKASFAKYGYLGNLASVGQVGINLLDNNGDVGSLTVGDALAIMAVVTTPVPALSLAFTIGGAAYAMHESQNGATKLRDIGNGVNNKISDVADQIANNVGETAINAHNAVSNGIDSTKNAFNSVASGELFKDSMDKIAPTIGNTAINTHNAITNGINNTKNTFNDITSGKAFRDSIDKLAPKVGEAAINMDKAINEAMANGAEKVNNAIQKATDAYKTAEQKIADAYKTAEQALKDGVKSAEEAVKEATQKAEQIAKDLAKEVSETFKEVSDNLADAFDKYRQAAEDAFNKWKQQAEDFFDDFKLPNPFDDLPDDLAEAFAKWTGINRSGFHYFYDPLALDLDGDGIETIAHDKLKKAVFDHDGDGIAHATGWVKKDDGILVLDRNGDGVINDGREVFGDSTILRTGETAKHGYEALADLDSDGNGKINADDAKFNELRVWRDLDSDGVSDVGELFGLHELGIGALNLDYQEVDKNLTGGNKLTQLGSYEKHDGKTQVSWAM
ncbi:Uncharacterised protein [Moraxella caprae]|uniref:Uncharacterized protein n=1 Tax=Moraxella caprae TaxID=90240 RepID=A0A378QXU2_9GAMM|nr:hypothetical protein [Moraxella caprae]STZ07745.1 Uncharacterised protein [Moraxella caprae]